MECFFGNIENGIMKPNIIGKIVHDEWLKTLELRPDMNLEMGEFIVMPNHFHAIIFIGENKYNTNIEDCATNKFGKQSSNLAAIVRGFKSAVTRQVRIHDSNFEWQALYHNHIIRTADSFENIAHYIVGNPEKWQEDRFFS